MPINSWPSDHYPCGTDVPVDGLMSRLTCFAIKTALFFSYFLYELEPYSAEICQTCKYEVFYFKALESHHMTEVIYHTVRGGSSRALFE